MLLFPESGPKKNFWVTASPKTATPESGSKKDFRVTASLQRDSTPSVGVVLNVQRHMAYFAIHTKRLRSVLTLMVLF